MRFLKLLIAASLIISPAAAHSDHSEADPGRLPGDPFYGFDRFGEKIDLMFASETARKAELKLKFAEERLLEAEALLEKEREEESAETFREYRKTMEEVRRMASESSGNEIMAEYRHYREKRSTLRSKMVDRLDLEESKPREIDSGSFMATGNAIN